MTLPSDEGGHLAGDHLLLAILLVREPVEVDACTCRPWSIGARDQLDVGLLLVRRAGEAEEHQHDADVDDVAAVAPLAADAPCP